MFSKLRFHKIYSSCNNKFAFVRILIECRSSFIECFCDIRDVEWRHEILSTFQFFGVSLSLWLYFTCEKIIFPSLLTVIESLFICTFAWEEVVWIDSLFGYLFRPIKSLMSPFWVIKMTNFLKEKSYVYKAVTQVIDTAF